MMIFKDGQGGKVLKQVLASVLISASLFACSDDDDKDSRDEQRDLYVFGDSLSDTGNVGEIITFNDDLPDPFYENRISNGPVIVDYVAESLGTKVDPVEYIEPGEDGSNYAVVGGKAFSASPNLTLNNQIDFYLDNNNDAPDPNDVYLFFIGGNDVIDAIGEANPMGLLDQAAQAVGDAVEDIASRGGKLFFVLTVPDIGKTPDQVAGDAEKVAMATMLTNYYNAALQAQLIDVQARLTPAEAKGVKINVIDVFTIFDDVLARSVELGFTNTTKACYLISDFKFIPPCDATKIETYAFFDKIHPSGKLHKAVGEEVARQVKAAVN